MHFNPRTPVGCDRNSRCSRRELRRFQSTHPSGVRLEIQREHAQQQLISIHAPQWGATSVPLICVGQCVFQSTHPSGVRRDHQPAHCRGNQISIHAPQWGATRSTASSFRRWIHFNPRTPVGCDAAEHVHVEFRRHISIHAPQWGATVRVRPLSAIGLEFQSTHPSGVRPRGYVRHD